MEEFVTNSALLAGHLTQQCEKAIADQKQSAAELKHAAVEIGQGVAAGRAELAQSARSAVREALSQEIPAAVEAIAASGDRLRQLADQLQREHVSAASRVRALAWKSLVAITLASVVIIGATSYTAWNNVQRAQRAQVDAQVLEALQHVAITACDGRPCVKLADDQQRWTKNNDYLLVDGSSAKPAAK